MLHGPHAADPRISPSAPARSTVAAAPAESRLARRAGRGTVPGYLFPRVFAVRSVSIACGGATRRTVASPGCVGHAAIWGNFPCAGSLNAASLRSGSVAVGGVQVTEQSRHLDRLSGVVSAQGLMPL